MPYKIIQEICTGCGACLRVCPELVFTIYEDIIVLDITRVPKCTDCGLCAENCEAGALIYLSHDVMRHLSPYSSAYEFVEKYGDIEL